MIKVSNLKNRMKRTKIFSFRLWTSSESLTRTCFQMSWSAAFVTASWCIPWSASSARTAFVWTAYRSGCFSQVTVPSSVLRSQISNSNRTRSSGICCQSWRFTASTKTMAARKSWITISLRFMRSTSASSFCGPAPRRSQGVKSCSKKTNWKSISAKNASSPVPSACIATRSSPGPCFGSTSSTARKQSWPAHTAPSSSPGRHSLYTSMPSATRTTSTAVGARLASRGSTRTTMTVCDTFRTNSVPCKSR